MKCIYCNSENDMTVSDIIPWALTGKKVRKKFVCHTHNAFTNDNYEKAVIQSFAAYRNILGLSERDGDPVRFTADLEIDGYKIENANISDRSSVVGMKRNFSTTDKDGKKVIIGDRTNLLKIKGATESQIKAVNLSNISFTVTSNIQELFISTQMLHMVAKIAYEWHCFINNLDGCNSEKYKNIISYILNPRSNDSPVEIVLCRHTWALMDQFSRTGTNMLFEYKDTDGKIYVVFGFWNVIIYKICICDYDVAERSINRIDKVFFYHTDGTDEEHSFLFLSGPHIESKAGEKGLSPIHKIVRSRMSCLGERDISQAYLQNNVEKLKRILPKYKKGTCSFAELIDFEDEDRILSLYILELLLKHKAEYNMKESFAQNSYRILNTQDRFVITLDKKKEIIKKYADMDQAGELVTLIEDAISFFEQITY